MGQVTSTTQVRRNRYGFGVGTIGRDMTYVLISLFLIYFFSDVLDVSTEVLAGVTVVMVVVRIFDAVNDPFMGVLIDNTSSRWGRFKPWILGGALTSSLFTVLMFTDRTTALNDALFIGVFALLYLAWEVTYTANDIGYWSMLPALSQDQTERERIGAFARICANIGTFSMVVAIVPITEAIADFTGSASSSFFWLAIVLVTISVICQLITLALVQEDRTVPVTHERTQWRELLPIIVRNDQLMAIVLALALFMTAFTTTVSLAIYYFKYVFGDETMYSVFAAVLGVAQLSALAGFGWFSRRYTRHQIFTGSVISVAAGYLVFFLAPAGTLPMLIVGAIGIFAGQAMIQLLMVVFVADTVEYGQWKLGRRNTSVTVSLQPFVYKLGSAIAAGIVGWTVIASGMKEAEGAADMTDAGVALVKTMMLLVPLALIVASWFVYRRLYRLDAQTYQRIVAELVERDGSA